MPLVKYLTSKQCDWLAQQPFMADADAHVDDDEWSDSMDALQEEDQMWRKLCFAGFRDDLRAFSQSDREERMGKDAWLGASVCGGWGWAQMQMQVEWHADLMPFWRVCP